MLSDTTTFKESTENRSLASIWFNEYNNPTFGLQLWGPLIPASDRPMALFALSTIQLSIGLKIFNFARRMKFPMKIQDYIDPKLMSFSKNPGRNNLRYVSNKLLKFPLYATGSFLMFYSGLEYSRLALPFDPYCEDAQIKRKISDDLYLKLVLKDKLYDDNASKWNKFVFYWSGPNDVNRLDFDTWLSRYELYLERSGILITTSYTPKNDNTEDEKLEEQEILKQVKEKKEQMKEVQKQLHDDSKKHYLAVRDKNSQILQLYLTQDLSFYKDDIEYQNRQSNLIIKQDEFPIPRLDSEIELELFNNDFELYWVFRVNPWAALQLHCHFLLSIFVSSPTYSKDDKK